MKAARPQSKSSWSLASTCPVCSEPLRVTRISCDPCGLDIQHPHLSTNEFSLLNQDELHLLRIFLRFEGRVSDMEVPMGLSYPTLRNRISALNKKIQSLQDGIAVAARSQTKIKQAKQGETPVAQNATIKPAFSTVLEKLSKGEINFDESINLIEQLRK